MSCSKSLSNMFNVLHLLENTETIKNKQDNIFVLSKREKQFGKNLMIAIGSHTLLSLLFKFHSLMVYQDYFDNWYNCYKKGHVVDWTVKTLTSSLPITLSSFDYLKISGLFLLTSFGSYIGSLLLSQKLDLDILSDTSKEIDSYIEKSSDDGTQSSDIVVNLKQISTISKKIINLKMITIKTNIYGGCLMFSGFGLIMHSFTRNHNNFIFGGTVLTACYLVGYNIYEKLFLETQCAKYIAELKRRISHVKNQLNDADLIDLIDL